jgi:hypothetical protein
MPFIKDAQHRQADEFEDRLADLVAEYQGLGMDLMTLSSILELQTYAVNEAMNES